MSSNATTDAAGELPGEDKDTANSSKDNTDEGNKNSAVDAATTKPEGNSKCGRRAPSGKNRKVGKSVVPKSEVGIHQSRHLQRLKCIERNAVILLRQLSACQIKGRELDPRKVSEYAERLELSEAPNCVVIRDSAGKNHLCTNHRAAAALQAGRTTIVADVYEGEPSDAVIVGGELNQGPIPMKAAAKNAHLEAILDSAVHYSINEMAEMCGLDRHTVSNRVAARAAGDFIDSVGSMKREKTDEEKMNGAAQAILKQVERLGVGVVVRALESMTPHLRDEIIGKFTSQ